MGIFKNRWVVEKGKPLTEMDKKILAAQKQGHKVPTRKLIKTEEQIEGIRRSGVINTGILDMITAEIKEGMTTWDLDELIGQYTADHGAISACMGYEGYPRYSCISIDDVVCHGIPDKKSILRPGMIVNVDVSTILDGYFSDASRMFIIGETTEEKQRLVDVAKECLMVGMQAAKPYSYVGDIGFAVQCHAQKNGYSVVRELCGHGVGLEFHEEPEVTHYGRPKTGMLLVPGMVFTIEPMINMGTMHVHFSQVDGWTVTTLDHQPSAQWEHTFVMRETGLEILTH
ncbi:MAG: type I methionyl aminopeptidase [Marinilabiliaceae bacterium]|nr:type I methionyl aminopeptidase [Marinilabiliaceae bacterium]